MVLLQFFLCVLEGNKSSFQTWTKPWTCSWNVPHMFWRFCVWNVFVYFVDLQLQQPTDQEVEDFLNQEDFSFDGSSRRSSVNSLFLKAMDGRPRRRQSLYSRARGSGGPQSPDPPNGRRSSLKDPAALEMENLYVPSEGSVGRRASATELLLMPLKQFVSQSQKAFEYLSPNSPDTAIATANWGVTPPSSTSCHCCQPMTNHSLPSPMIRASSPSWCWFVRSRSPTELLAN